MQLPNHESMHVMFISIQMVLCWLSGDIFKTCYFVARIAPSQFWLCGTLQVLVDILILSQVALYRHSQGSGGLNPKSPRTKINSMYT
jgi:hypothetical protein